MICSKNFCNVRLICSDIDGTLIEKRTPISNEVRQKIVELQKAGIAFSFVTGRLPYEIEPLMEGLPEHIPYSAGNGTLLIQDEKILSESSFVPGILKTIAEKYSQLGVTVIFSIKGLERTLKVTEWALENADTFPGLDDPVDESIWKTSIQRMFFYEPSSAYLRECENELQPFADSFTICKQNPYSIQISPKGRTKGTGAAEIAELLGIPQENVLCIGDAQNDIPMIEYAGIGVAVANASNDLKKSADYVTEGIAGKGFIEVADLCIGNKKVQA